MNIALRDQLSKQITAAGFESKYIDWLQRMYDFLADNNGFPINHLDLLAAALKQPKLFSQKPETLHTNVTQSAQLTGVTKEQFVAAALKQPQLFCQKPKTLDANVTESAQLMGVTKEQFAAAALKHPSLFYQKPETLHAKVPYVMLLDEACKGMGDLAYIIRLVPSCLSRGKSHLHARYVLAKLGLKKGKISSLTTFPLSKTTDLIRQHFEAQIARTGKGARALQVMHAQGMIASLPDSIRPIEKPPRRQRHLMA